MGKVLVAGGYIGNGSSDLSSAELYDPTTGTWTNTGSLNVARSENAATLLPNGKVLVVGGQGNTSSSISSAELYDPTTGTWTNTGSLNTGREGHSVTLRPNGQVLVAGGFGNSTSLASAELYDPATGVWTYTGSMNLGRWDHTATLLPNGKVLITAGKLSTNKPGAPLTSSTEQYDAPSDFLQISGQLLITGAMQLTFNGIAEANYALDRSPSLAPGNWTPQATNSADSTGALVFTNIPDATTNNFWRIRSVP